MAYSDLSFIEVQFPVSKVSKESYKERKANLGQTLTGLGKWWGRKPLILVRAALLGLLMPASENPKKDREIFLKILTMDDEGLWLRKNKSIPMKVVYENLTVEERKKYFEESNGKASYRKGIIREERKTCSAWFSIGCPMTRNSPIVKGLKKWKISRKTSGKILMNI